MSVCLSFSFIWSFSPLFYVLADWKSSVDSIRLIGCRRVAPLTVESAIWWKTEGFFFFFFRVGGFWYLEMYILAVSTSFGLAFTTLNSAAVTYRVWSIPSRWIQLELMSSLIQLVQLSIAYIFVVFQYLFHIIVVFLKYLSYLLVT